jgi:hypothetical protein
MTQIQTVRRPSRAQGPQGVGGSTLGGTYSQLAQDDLVRTDSFQDGITELSGTTDALDGHKHGNYVIKTGSADAITLGVPTAGVDDGRSVNIFSDTLFAHTVTLPSAAFATGAATVKTIATFPAFRGAGLVLRAYNGTWQVIGNTGPVLFT